MTRTTQQLLDLTGKNALITGGSGSFGLQMAHALGEAGARIMLSDRNADELEVAMSDLHDAGMDARWVAADWAVEKDLEKLVSETRHRMGDVDILVNNPGCTWGAPESDLSADAWDRVMNTRLRGYFLLSQLVGRQSMIGRGGCVINVACHVDTLACHTVHGAVINFTRALACEWRQHRINVNAICPEGFSNRQMSGTPSWMPLGCDEHLKGVTLLFASDAGKHITGQWLAVDGGLCAVQGA